MTLSTFVSPIVPFLAASALAVPAIAQVFTGNATVLSTNGGGEVTTLHTEGSWRSTWHACVTGSFGGGGGRDVLLYDRITGEGRFVNIDAVTGNLTTIVAQTNWSTTWDQVVAGQFGGTGQTDLLLYNARSGIARIYTTGAGGSISLLASFSGWQEWDTIVAGQFGGGGHSDLFLYSRTRGEGKFFVSDGSGGLTLLQTYTALNKNWDQIAVGDYNGDGFSDLFFYQRVLGLGRFYTTDGAGGLTLLQQHSGLRTSWDLIVNGDFGGSGRDDLLFYDRTAGEARFAFTDGAGGWALQPLRSVPKTWSHLVMADTSSLDRVFAYDNQVRVRIHAVKCEDDNGGRATAITPAQVQQWVDRANECYARAGVRIEFHAATDFEVLRNTVINTLDLCSAFPTSAQCDTHKAAATQWASQHPCKIVVFFRWGYSTPSSPGATGSGFSGEAANYVAMPGFNATATMAYYQNPANPLHGQSVQGIKLLAHELGHYFGLDHSGIDFDYAATPSPHAQVVSYLSQFSNPSMQTLDPDHDDVWDTPPDVHRDYYLLNGWNPADLTQEITISSSSLGVNFTFSPDRHNVMSYFGICDDYLRLSPDQVREVREVLHTSKVNRISTCAHVVTGRWVPYGSGCPGSGGVVPVHGVLGPVETGSSFALTVTGAVGMAPAVVCLGDQMLNQPLAAVGMGTCRQYVGNFGSAGFTVGANGNGALTIAMPSTSTLVGAIAYSQIAVLDYGAATSLPVVATGGVELFVGGSL
jgi:hypothetical protein